MIDTKLNLPDITLIGIDCVDLKRLQLAREICELGCTFGDVKLLSSIASTDFRVIPIQPINSTKQYSKFIIQHLTEYIDTEYALIFQHDGFILNPDAWTNDFLTYDYIGAPWHHLEDIRVGNGGFSLRSKKLLDFIAQNHKEIGGDVNPEDLWIARRAGPHLREAGMQFAPVPVAQKFSKEGSYRGVFWNGEFGFHGLSYTNISKWLKKHPNYKNKLKIRLSNAAKLMSKYSTGRVHMLNFRAPNMKSYVELAGEKRDYEARLMKTESTDIQLGHVIVFKRSGVPFKKVPIPAFEKKVRKIEKFNSLSDLREKHPDVHITFPASHRRAPNPKPVWLEKVQQLFGDYFYPKDKPYIIFWF